MSINIKNREVEALISEIKAATGKGTSEIVRDLVRQEAARLRKARDIAKRRRRIMTLSQRYCARLSNKTKAPDDIVGYDEHGLPK